VCDSVLSHLLLLVRADIEIAPGLCPAQQRKSLGRVLREIGIRIALIDRACEQPAGAGQAPALVADRRKEHTVPGRGVPDVLIGTA